ncbi:unnamed protein product [Ilex paraguariensis]|uniref:X8 domain-containing protein n=1 Tax=Ilex paraguariensis TaxID=185542 RepID=A0ABC8R815_9AQUA
MARTLVLILAFCMLFFSAQADLSQRLGLNWGRHTTQKLLPSMVIDLLLENGIKKVKLFSLNDAVLTAFAYTDIEVIVSIPSILLDEVNTTDDARGWVKENIGKYLTNVKITNIGIGNEPFSTVDDEQVYLKVISVMKDIQTALNEASYGHIKANIPHFTDILKPFPLAKPSDADFRDDIKDYMLQVLRHLRVHHVPFLANISPVFLINQLSLTDIEFLFLENYSNYTIKDNDITYTNAFDAIYDAFVSALTKNGFPEMKIIVGEVGWPTDGSKEATIANAERFFKGFLKRMASEKGTPLRPEPLEAYLYNLQDENRVKIARSGYQRHWGIYKFDGTPKFKIDFTGQGRDIYPNPVKGVVVMPLRWCVFNNDVRDMTMVQRNFNLACNLSDCSSLASGGSCSDLDFNHQVSYAFNMYYQIKTQKANDFVCQFDGLGKIVTENPRKGKCEFPVEILMSLEDRGVTTKASGLIVNSALLMIFFAFYEMIVIW